MRVDNNIVVSIEPEEEMGINMNWHHLCNMAQPIVDKQLDRLAMHQV
jgi:hypothetical protein